MDGKERRARRRRMSMAGWALFGLAEQMERELFRRQLWPAVCGIEHNVVIDDEARPLTTNADIRYDQRPIMPTRTRELEICAVYSIQICRCHFTGF